MRNLFNSLLIISCITTQLSNLQAQNNVGIGTPNPNNKAILELKASDKGLLLPRVTTAQRLAINPAGNTDEALLVYDSDDSLFYFWNSAQWVPFPQQGSNNISLNYDANTGNLSLTDNGGTLTTNIPPDNDADSTNELITGVVFNANGNILTINEGGNIWSTTISIVDPDSDPTNEIQELTINNNILNLSISNNNVDLAPYLDNTDNQTLSITGDTLSISNGNSVAIPTLPTGIICMWSGSINNIPAGWALCDGANGTPDLRDRFIVGAGSNYAVAATGGTNTISINTANLPAHSHTFSATTGTESNTHTHGVNITTGNESTTHTHSGITNLDGAHTHTQNYSQNRVNSGTSINVSDNNGSGSTKQIGTDGAHQHSFTTGGQSTSHTHLVNGNTGNQSVNHTHNVSGTTDAIGLGTALDIRPLYYALAYIMKL